MFKRRNKIAAQLAKEVSGLDFEAEIARRSYRSERIAWGLVVVFALIAGLCAGAVMLLTPLKQTVPYFVYVDKETGVQQAVVVEDPQKITESEAVTRYWLNRYVLARERYVYRLLQEDYEFVMATSEIPVGKEYSRQYEGPDSRAEQIKETVEERINILSVQVVPGARGRGTVRFQKITWRMGLREPESVKTYVADLAYTYKNVSQWSGQDLLKNPVGFTVLAYRITQELDQR
jgi:type IV secretion system protein VirB8